MASAKYSPQPVADSESGESDYENSERCVENLHNRMPHWNCCVWFCIIVATAMIISEVLAWLRQPVCGSANFSWNEVIPPNTVNQIERNNSATMLQEYDVSGSWTKLWHFDVYENATASSSSGTDQQAKIFRGSWSNGHLLFGFSEKMAYVDTTGPEKSVALEGRKMWGTIGSSFELWLCSRPQHSYEVSVDSEPWELTVVYNIHRMPSRESIAKTRFESKDVSFWSDESYWEATVIAAGGNDTGEVIGTVKQNISSFDSKWFVVNKRPDSSPNEVMSFMTLVYDVDETRQS